MKTIIIEQALDELKAALEYYEKQQSGLGLKLTEEIDQHVKWISQNAGIPRLRPGGYRRVNLKIFPFYIAYITKKKCSLDSCDCARLPETGVLDSKENLKFFLTALLL